MSKMKGNELEGKTIGITRPAERVAEAVRMVKNTVVKHSWHPRSNFESQIHNH